MITINMDKDASPEWREAIVWCMENFGPSYEWRNINRWTYKFQGKFIFVNEEDAVLFALRWS